MGALEFRTTLVSRGPGVAVILDEAQAAAVGEGAKRFPIAATINGHRWQTTVVRMRGEFMFGLSKETRSSADVQAGDEVDVRIELDSAERTVEVSGALAAALAADPDAAARFDALAFTHRKEFARWIEEAKREETRERRVTQALEMIRTGRTRS